MNLIKTNDLIYVAGHNGLAGKAICKSLKSKGYYNLLLSNKDELDLRNEKDVQQWFSKNKPDIVILAAAKVGGIYANQNYPVEFLLDNLKIQNNVIQYAYRSGTRRLLFLGSSCIYPKYSRQPISEEDLLTSSLESSNESYAIAKIAGIKLCQAFRRQYGFDAICIMPTNLYGTGDNYHPQNSHVLPALLRKFHLAKINNDPHVTCWGSGKPYREFLHSQDLGDACVFVLQKWNPSSIDAPLDSTGNPLLILNIGTGKDLTIKELATSISKVIGYEGKINWDTSKPDGTPKKLLNIRKIRELGWEANINLMDGLEITYSQFLKDSEINKG